MSGPSLLLLLGKRAVHAPPAPVVAPLTLSANTFSTDVAVDSVLSEVSPDPLEPGETRAFDPPMTRAGKAYFTADGLQVLRGLEAWSAGTFSFETVRSTPSGSARGAWNVTLYAPSEIGEVTVSDLWVPGTDRFGAPDSGWPEGEVPASSDLDTTTVRMVVDNLLSWHDVVTDTLLLCFDSDSVFSAADGVEYLVEGNTLAVPAPNWGPCPDPRTGETVPLWGYWARLRAPEGAIAGTINVRVRGKSSNLAIAPTVSRPFPYYPRATECDILLKPAWNAGVAGATHTGPTAIDECLIVKRDNPDKTVWIEVQDNPPTLGWDIAALKLGHDTATVHTRIYGKAGNPPVRFGAYTRNGFQPGIDGIEWGVNTRWVHAAMGNGSAPFKMPSGGMRVKFWGMEHVGGDPEGDGAPGWSGSGSSALFNRRQPATFWLYPQPSDSQDVTIIAGFSHMEGIPCFGWGYTRLNVYCSAKDISGSCFENCYGATTFCTAERVGGVQAGLRAYNPAILITPPPGVGYVAVEKIPTNGNVVVAVPGAEGEPTKFTVPLTLLSGGSGYTDGEYAESDTRWGVTGGSGQGALVDVTVEGGVVTKAYISKDTTAGTGYKIGDILTLEQLGVTPTAPATIQLGGSFRVYEGDSEETAVVTHQFLITFNQSRQELIDAFNSWEGWTAVDLNPDHDLSLTFLTYDAQPAIGVPVANIMASAIAKRTWTAGASFTLSLGCDIHSNVVVISATRKNLIFSFNRFSNYIGSAPFSFGRSAVLNGVIVKFNRWYDVGPEAAPPYGSQQGYWMGYAVHMSVRQNTALAASNQPGTGGGFYFGTTVQMSPYVEIASNLIDDHVWTTARDEDVTWRNNVIRNRSQAQVDALTGAPAGGDNAGLGGIDLSQVVPGAAAGDFRPLALVQRADLSWPGALDGSGNYAGLPPPP